MEQFLKLLQAHAIQQLVDVRTIPRSRHNPQFNSGELSQSLAQAGMVYRQLKELGGLRPALKHSVNTGWANASFRGYADYMQTEAFAQGLQALSEIARERPTAIMCAEAVPWKCHRSLIADALTVSGWEVRHIQSRKTAAPHTMTPFAVIRNHRLIYPQPSENFKEVNHESNLCINRTGNNHRGLLPLPGAQLLVLEAEPDRGTAGGD